MTYLGAKQVRTLAVLAAILALVGCAARQPALIVDHPPLMKAGRDGDYLYVVRPGDTLYQIARQHNVSVDDLIERNALGSPDLIRPGDGLYIAADRGSAVPVVASRPVAVAVQEPKPVSVEPPAQQAKPVATPVVPSSVPESVSPDKSPVSEPIEVAAQPVAVPTLPVVEEVTTAAEPVARTSSGSQERVPTAQSVSNVKVYGRVNDGNLYPGWQFPVAAKPSAGYTTNRKGLDYLLNDYDEIVAAADGEVVYAGVGINKYKHMIIVDTKTGYMIAYEFNGALNLQEQNQITRGDRITFVDPSDANEADSELHRRFHFEIWRDGDHIDPRSVIEK